MADGNPDLAVPGYTVTTSKDRSAGYARPVYAVGGIGDGMSSKIALADGNPDLAVPGDTTAIGEYGNTCYARPIYAVGGIGYRIGAIADSDPAGAVPGDAPAFSSKYRSPQSRPIYAVGGIGDGIVPTGVRVADGDKSGAVPGNAITAVGEYRSPQSRPIYAVGGIGDGIGALADGDPSRPRTVDRHIIKRINPGINRIVGHFVFLVKYYPTVVVVKYSLIVETVPDIEVSGG